MADMTRIRRWVTLGVGCAALAGALVYLSSCPAGAAPMPVINLPDINVGISPEKAKQPLVLPLQMLMLMTILSLAPYILVMTTSFIRITIVLSFLRTAMGTQQVPPTQVLMGLGLFMTLYIMMPVGSKINNEALKPYLAEKISQKEFFDKASTPMKEFMLRQTRDKDLYLFVKLGKVTVTKRQNVPLHVLLPAFVISEVKTAFEIGFLLYIPFLVVDMVVSSVLMSMGMFMMSPMTISLPFKLLLFVMIDGWQLIVDGLVRSFK